MSGKPCLAYLSETRGNTKWVEMVQLVVYEDTKCYRVIVVCSYSSPNEYVAHCFDSRTCAWSYVKSGLVWGKTVGRYNPGVLDCTTKKICVLEDCIPSEPPSLEDADVRIFVLVKDHLFVLHQWWLSAGLSDFTVSEYVLRISTSGMDMMTHIMTSNKRRVIDINEDYDVHFFACSGFALLFADKLGDDGVNRHQVLSLFDSTANDWRDVSMGDDVIVTNKLLRMCEQRWDALP